MSDWKPINTAPFGEFVYDGTNDDPRLPYKRMRMTAPLKVRGTHEGETEEFCAVWTILDDREGYWFEDEPIDWSITEWRPLTEAEHKALKEIP